MIRVKKDVALALHLRSPPTMVFNELLQMADELGIILKPLHPDIEDLQLSYYFTIDVPDILKAQKVISSLKDCRAIEAAYLKPKDEMP